VPTFADLEIDFPLFGADVSEASGWQPHGVCEICSQQRSGFEIGMGDYVESPCATCEAVTPMPANNHPAECVQCQAEVQLLRDLTGSHGCWRCLRSGRWASTKDTEAGAVTPVHALLGRTHGLPFPPGALADTAWRDTGSNHPTLAGWPVTDPNEDGWRAAIIPSKVLVELVRSPTYITWQGEQWLFHCRRPMKYAGPWGKLEFDAAAPNRDGRSLALSSAGLHEDAWQDLSDSAGECAVLAYMFECLDCRAHRGHWDID